MKERGKRNNVAYPQIHAILDGDIEAINAAVKHYKGYITKLATRNLYDEYGNVYLLVDDKIVRILELKLIKAIISDYRLILEN